MELREHVPFQYPFRRVVVSLCPVGSRDCYHCPSVALTKVLQDDCVGTLSCGVNTMFLHTFRYKGGGLDATCDKKPSSQAAAVSCVVSPIVFCFLCPLVFIRVILSCSWHVLSSVESGFCCFPEVNASTSVCVFSPFFSLFRQKDQNPFLFLLYCTNCVSHVHVFFLNSAGERSPAFLMSWTRFGRVEVPSGRKWLTRCCSLRRPAPK